MIDEFSYVLRVAPYLQKFKRDRKGGALFRCPVCGDSSKSKYKTRGSLFLHQGSYMFHCYNCSVSWSLYQFLQYVDAGLAKEYSVDKFKSEARYEGNRKTIRQTYSPVSHVETSRSNHFVEASTLNIDHPARKYLTSRKIPRLDRVSYIENPKEWLEGIGEKTIHDHPQIAFQLKDFNGHWFGTQLRALDSSQQKYRFQTVIFEQGHTKAFGCEHINKDAQTLYVVEGASDSLMLDNSIAALDASLHTTASKLGLDREKTVLIFDNEASNREVVANMVKAIDDKWKIVIWPKTIKSKDLNQCVCTGESLDFVQTCVYDGLAAKIKLSTWKNV